MKMKKERRTLTSEHQRRPLLLVDSVDQGAGIEELLGNSDIANEGCDLIKRIQK
jgi:hypothetical protein